MGLPYLWAPYTDNSNNGLVQSADDVKSIEEEDFLGGSAMSCTQTSRTNMEDEEEQGCESSCSPNNEAAVMLQKAYKSFRTRRKLADCAVLIQNWREQEDFAKLEHSSVSFFDIDHQETAISRWSRAKTRAAKVGKGLSKNGKARKLALQHWLEAIDPRHRYGHNLHFYYDKWLQSEDSREPFFYWLDIGEGKEVNLEKCPRRKLQQQCIKYLGPMERLAYEVCIENGRMYFKQSGEVVDTLSDSQSKWIFVLSASKVLYIGKKKKGSFQHSSFLSGGATSAAGRLVVDNGVLKAVWPHSGHYRPTPENFQEFVSFLGENNVDLSEVKMDPADDEDDKLSITGSQTISSSGHHTRNNSEEDLSGLVNNLDDVNNNNNINLSSEEGVVTVQEEEETVDDKSSSSIIRRSGNLTPLQIPRRNVELYMSREQSEEEEDKTEDETEDKTEVDETNSVSESILDRIINTDKEAKSCRWTTGAGPRISCVGDHPSKLYQVQALEQLSLSPRSSATRHHLLKSESGSISSRAGSSLKSLSPDSISFHSNSYRRTNAAIA